MKFTLLAAVAAAALLSANPADARRGGGGYAEGLLFVANTQEKDGTGAPLSLCILERTEKILFLPIWRSPKAYVLAPNQCDTEQFYSLNEDGMTLGQAAGVFPADLPQEPQLNFKQRAVGMWGTSLAVPLFLFGIAAKFGGAGRGRSGGIANSFVGRAVQAMAMVAKADGSVSNDEIAVMRNVIAQLTQKEIPMQEIANIVAGCPAQMTDGQLRKLGKGLDQAHRELMVQAATMVAASDGAFEGAENHVIYRLSKALMLPISQRASASSC